MLINILLDDLVSAIFVPERLLRLSILDEGEDDVDGDTALLGDGAAANPTGASLGTVPAELLARKSSGYSSLSSASMPLAAHSTVTMDGSRQFITIQRQLTKERNQRVRKLLEYS